MLKPVTVILSVIFLSVGSLSTLANEEPKPLLSAWNLEALPPALALRVRRQEEAFAKLGLDEVPRGVYSRLKLWPPSQRRLRVCFMGGAKETRRRIADYADQWASADTGLSFDFGSDSDPRLCSPQDEEIAHIRIGFDELGYWSFVGQDSVLLATQAEKSMNLEGFDTAPPDDEEFRRVVLHEFGHALGFQHEHQNPIAECESEFDWPRIYKYLQGAPNYWSREQVDYNMRKLHQRGLTADRFDRASIMLYTFPVNYFKRGASSACFAPYTTELSAGDRRLIGRMYPKDRSSDVDQYVSDRDLLLGKAEESENDENAKAASLEILKQYLPTVDPL